MRKFRGDGGLVSHRCLHYRYRARNPAFRAKSRLPAFQLKCPAFRAKSRLPAFQLKCPAFCVFRNDRVTYPFVIFCFLPVWNLKLRLHGRRLSPGYKYHGLSELGVNPCIVAQ